MHKMAWKRTIGEGEESGRGWCICVGLCYMTKLISSGYVHIYQLLKKLNLRGIIDFSKLQNEFLPILVLIIIPS